MRGRERAWQYRMDNSTAVTRTVHTHKKHNSIHTVQTNGILAGGNRERGGLSMMLSCVLEGKTVRKERGTSEMIKECLYIEIASPGHNLIGLHLLGLFAKGRNECKRRVGARPHRKEQTKAAEDTKIVRKRVRQPEITRLGWQSLRPQHQTRTARENGMHEADTLHTVFCPQSRIEGLVEGALLVPPTNLVDLPQDRFHEAGRRVGEGGDGNLFVAPLHSFGWGISRTLYHGRCDVTKDLQCSQLATHCGFVAHAASGCILEFFLGWHFVQNLPPQLRDRELCGGSWSSRLIQTGRIANQFVMKSWQHSEDWPETSKASSGMR